MKNVNPEVPETAAMRPSMSASAPALRPLRVLHVVPTYYPAERYGGPIHSVHGLCAALARAGHTVDVCTTSVDGKARLDLPEGPPVDVDGVQVRYFRSRFDRLYWSPAMSSFLQAHTAEYDIVHLHSVYLWPTTSAAYWARRRRVPYLLAPRGMLVPELIRARSAWLKRAWITVFERRNLNRAARVHLTSRQEELDLARCAITRARTMVLPNGVATAGETDRRVVSGQVLYLGRLSWKKNLIALVQAIAAIPTATLLLAGPDDEGLADALRQAAGAAGCADRVRIIGRVGADEKRELFATSACAVLPSLNENFGNVVIEAMAHGCPVVVAPGVGARTVVEACGGGLVAASGDAAALRGSIVELLDHPASAEAMGAAGARYVAINLSWETIASQMATVYREIRSEVGA